MSGADHRDLESISVKANLALTYYSDRIERATLRRSTMSSTFQTSPTLKNNSPQRTVKTVQQIEDTADNCFESLAIKRRVPEDSIFALLVGGIRRVEAGLLNQERDPAQFDVLLSNLGRALSTSIKWMVQAPRGTVATGQTWNSELEKEFDATIDIANRCSNLLWAFPLWHLNYYAAELKSETHVRFSTLAGDRQRQVSAYQKGMRPTTGPERAVREPTPQQRPEVAKLFASVLRSCKESGAWGFAYEDPLELWQELLPDYQKRVSSITRRDPNISLGTFTLGDFNRVYSALLSICAAHEHLCFLWQQRSKVYPSTSCVLVRTVDEWNSSLAALSGLNSDKCGSILNDLTFDLVRGRDLHTQPMIPFDADGNRLAVAPPFPLHSRHDENALSVCSERDPNVYSIASVAKETEMLAAIVARLRHFTTRTAVKLPNGNPDIDLIVEDPRSSTVLFAELKWIRKPLKAFEIPARDADVRKGVKQQIRVQAFLQGNPGHLAKSGKMSAHLNTYANVYYLVVCRDHWTWVDPENDIFTVEYSAFENCLRNSTDLKSALDRLLKYEWLPTEGRDFHIQFLQSKLNDVVVECELYFPGPAAR